MPQQGFDTVSLHCWPDSFSSQGLFLFALATDRSSLERDESELRRALFPLGRRRLRIATLGSLTCSARARWSTISTSETWR